MDALTAIKTRRSVRRYTSQPLDDATLTEVLRCGMQAPSACNEQPWQFVVVRDKTLLAKAGDINPYAKFAKNAPVAVLVCGDMRLDRCQGYWVQDCSNCAMSMLLAAHALGLGAVWTGIYPLADRVEGFRKLCGLPAEVTPLALLVLGHMEQTPKPEDRFKAERIHHDRW
ncbi:MAG: nitroreductase family protein [Desulfovibrionaceae bacterium CG1_02_65_16]|nr:MAG: nitroreductase family protein [Desulfovibrionaceae bacterium CG1_02_65_16]